MWPHQGPFAIRGLIIILIQIVVIDMVIVIVVIVMILMMIIMIIVIARPNQGPVAVRGQASGWPARHPLREQLNNDNTTTTNNNNDNSHDNKNTDNR